MMGSRIPRPLISVVVPAYNEIDALPELHARVDAVFEALPHDLEIVYVNDGSQDGTRAYLARLAAEDPRVTFIDLSRNFGKEIALTAGLDHVSGDAVVVIDADLQDPPELIPKMIEIWQSGYDVVYARRRRRHGESWLKRATARGFYWLIKRISRIEIPENTGDYRLLSRRTVDALKELRERHRFMKGLFAWVGFPQAAIEYDRQPRFAGNTKWSYWKLWNFALEGITSFTTVPLKLASYLGAMAALAGFAYAAWIIYKTIVYGDPVAGWPSLMVIVLVLGGIQLLGIGVLGEYTARMFDETKQRPLYIVSELHPSRSYRDRRSEGSFNDSVRSA